MQGLKSILRRPVTVIWIISLSLLLFSLAQTHSIRPYNSDDVSWQTILATWQPFDGSQVTLGSSDNFVDKLPFFMLLEQLFPPGRKLLLLEASILAVLGFSFFYVSCIYFLRKAKVKLSYTNLLPFVWLASFGYAFAQLYLLSIWRGFEMGISFLVFMLIAKFYFGEIVLKSAAAKLATLVLTMILGILLYSDPYILYFTLGPIAAFAVALFTLKKITATQLAITFACLLLSYFFSLATAFISTEAGIKMSTEYPTMFVSFENLSNNLELAVHGLLVIFGADFFDKSPASLTAIGAAINLLIVGFIGHQIYDLIRSGAGKRFIGFATIQLWMLFFAALCVFSVALYVVSTVAVDLSTYRYFIILVLCSIPLLALRLSSVEHGRKFLTLLLIAGIATNAAISLSGKPGYAQSVVTQNPANSVNFTLIGTAKAHSLTKGYATYWQGSINTYLSDNTVSFLPTVCSAGRSVKSYWLVHNDQFNKPAAKSFYLIDPDIPQPAVCTPKQLAAQFGKPSSVQMVGNKTMLIYDYDISSRMQ